MKRNLFVLIALLALATSACSSGETQPPPLPTVSPHQVEITTLIGTDQVVELCSIMAVPQTCMEIHTVGVFGQITTVVIVDSINDVKIGEYSLPTDGRTIETGEITWNPSYMGVGLRLSGNQVLVTTTTGWQK